MSEEVSVQRKAWPDYAAVWRWHFYAGLFCLPFVFWLAITGSLYLFKPDIDRFLDRPYEGLQYEGSRNQPSSEVAAALRAVPGATFSRYEPPETPSGAAQVVVQDGSRLMRVYVHPKTLQPMRIMQDNHRFTELIFNLHGNFLLGTRGSMLMELAASWAIVMFITGIYLWLPRNRSGLGGVLYPRLELSKRGFWRDIHAVTGIWISLTALFMLFSGLPWASSWGSYLTWARNLSTVTSGQPSWSMGGTSGKTDLPTMPGMTAEEMAAHTPSMPGMAPEEMAAHTPSMPGMTPEEMAAHTPSMPGMTPEEMAAHGGAGSVKDKGIGATSADYSGLDKILPVIAPLSVPRPVWILAPPVGSVNWTVSSQVQDRPHRITYTISEVTGEIVSRKGFGEQNFIDKAVDIAIATHEGHLFGRLNQMIHLITAAGLILLVISSTLLWWRRRPNGLLGAPRRGSAPRFSIVIAMSVVVLGLLLPLFGASFILVMVLERAVLRRLKGVSTWLGLGHARSARPA